MSLRRFASSGSTLGSGGSEKHVKRTNVTPLYFALVDRSMQFVKTRRGHVVTFTTREAANDACRFVDAPADKGSH
eukprot:SM010183S09136  [mRNA]  locus=s10183:2:402:- [translate_table: standard]